MKYLSVVLILLCFSWSASSQKDYWANLVYFSGCPVNHIPKGIAIPDKDKQARLILNSILAGASEEQIKLQFPDSLEIELRQLTDGKVIRRTNNSQFALSWSHNLFDEFFALPSTSSFYNLTVNKPVPDKDRSFFIRHGLSDSNNVAKIFCYVEDSALDSICNLLKSKYTGMVKGMFDYQKLSSEFQVPADELFLVVSHEIAYEIFSMINEKQASVDIPILKENNPTLDFSALVSWKMAGPFTNDIKTK